MNDGNINYTYDHQQDMGTELSSRWYKFEGGKKKAKRSKFTQRARLCIVCHAEPSAVLMSINDFILYILISICRNTVV